MKEFQDWIESFNTDGDGRKIYRDLPEKMMRTAWRDAFKRILKECHHYQNQDVIDFILKELEEN